MERWRRVALWSREDGMWDRLPVTLVTVLKPLLGSMSGIVRVSCPCAAAPGQHWRVQHTCIKPFSPSPLLRDLQSDLMSWKRVSRGARRRSHVYSGLLHCARSSVCLSAISFFHKSVFRRWLSSMLLLDGFMVCVCSGGVLARLWDTRLMGDMSWHPEWELSLLHWIFYCIKCSLVFWLWSNIVFLATSFSFWHVTTLYSHCH